MKRLAALLIGLFCLISCGKMKDGSDIVGAWKLDSELLNVEIEFMPDGSFTMSQVLVDGLPRIYTGTYTYINHSLSGFYSDGTAFATTYKVEFSGGKMLLYSGSEVYSYSHLNHALLLPRAA